jgi:protoheme IX farnesyltransferase
MTRFQRLALTTAVATYLLVVVGAVVRSTNSGMGCPDWPACNGSYLPPFGDSHALIEYIHRTIAAVIGFLALGVAVMAWRGYRDRRSILWPSLVAVVVVVIQAALGAITVAENNAGDTVTAHLATAMILLGILVFVAIRARFPAELPTRGGSQRFTLLATFAAASVYALLLFGSHVTATGAALVFPDWPLFNGAILPTFNSDPAAAALQMAQFLHRAVTVAVGIIVLVTAWVAMRQPRSRRAGVVGLIHAAAGLFIAQVFVGAAQIFTTLAPWAVALHLALGAAIWALTLGAAVQSYYLTRLEGRAAPAGEGEAATGQGGTAGGDPGTGGPGASGGPGTAAERGVGQASLSVAVERDGTPRDAGPAALDGDTVALDLLGRAPFTPAESAPLARPAGWRQTVGAYIALTKPRIIELLLVTTVPAMVLATRDVPGIRVSSWVMLVIATLIGGTLAAGSANAINCYIDRDIDELMSRTRRRPLPAHAVDPEHALVFGIALGVVSFAWLVVFANLLAAFLALLAIAFYVVVYTMLMKRTTPQNIVIGGAAGALPPVIGWAAVTGNVTLPALFLFAIVFYWTPPHFWALALRLSRDYAAAGVPMLPVVRGVRETNRQIILYTVLLVVLTLAFAVVAGMGLIYSAGAVLLGALFLRQAWLLWREGTGTGAIRLYRFSITYLAVLFALMALDVLIPIAL